MLRSFISNRFRGYKGYSLITRKLRCGFSGDSDERRIEKVRENEENAIKIDMPKVYNSLAQTSHEYIDLDMPDPKFKSSLIFFNNSSSSSNLKRNMSIRSKDLLKTADILLFEDERIAERLLGNIDFRIKRGKIEELMQEGYAQLTLNDEYTLEIKEEKEKIYDHFLKNSGEKDQMEFERMVNESKNVLKDLETFKKFKSEKRRPKIYDSLSYFDGFNDQYGLDNDYLTQVKDSIFMNRVKFNRGIIAKISDLDLDTLRDNLVQLMRAGLKIGVFYEDRPNASSDFLKKIAQEEGLPVETITGSSYFSYVLSSSGIPSDKFIFFEELPESEFQKKRKLQSIRDKCMTFGFKLEITDGSPSALFSTLTLLSEVFGQRQLIFIAVDIGDEKGEFKVKGEIQDLEEILKHDPGFKLNFVKEKVHVVVAPYAFQYNKGELS